MANVLILYATTEGHTARIAERIADACGAPATASIAGKPAPGSR